MIAHELVADGTCSGGCCTVFQCTRCTYRCVQAATLLPGNIHPDAEANEEVLLVERGIMDVGEAGADHDGSVRLAVDAAQYGDPLAEPAGWSFIDALLARILLRRGRRP